MISASDIAAFETDVMTPALAGAWPGTVVIGNVTFEGVLVILSPEQPLQLASGYVKFGQTLTVDIPKTRLAEKPSKTATIAYNGRDYKMETIGGDQETDLTWRLSAIYLRPGQP